MLNLGLTALLSIAIVLSLLVVATTTFLKPATQKISTDQATAKHKK